MIPFADQKYNRNIPESCDPRGLRGGAYLTFDGVNSGVYNNLLFLTEYTGSVYLRLKNDDFGRVCTLASSQGTALFLFTTGSTNINANNSIFISFSDLIAQGVNEGDWFDFYLNCYRDSSNSMKIDININGSVIYTGGGVNEANFKAFQKLSFIGRNSNPSSTRFIGSISTVYCVKYLDNVGSGNIDFVDLNTKLKNHDYENLDPTIIYNFEEENGLNIYDQSINSAHGIIEGGVNRVNDLSLYSDRDNFGYNESGGVYYLQDKSNPDFDVLGNQLENTGEACGV